MFSKLYFLGVILIFLLKSNFCVCSNIFQLNKIQDKISIDELREFQIFNLNISRSLFFEKCNLDDNKWKQVYFYPNQKDTITYNKLPQNSIYLELFGFGIFYSVNYERILFENKNNIITGRIGFSGFTLTYPHTAIIIPVLINYQTNINKTISFEIGCGYRFINRSIIANVGFRFLLKNNFLFKINFTPQLYGFESKGYTVYIGKVGGFNPYGGISFGYSFGK